MRKRERWRCSYEEMSPLFTMLSQSFLLIIDPYGQCPLWISIYIISEERTIPSVDYVYVDYFTLHY